MTEYLFGAFATLLVTIDPIGLAPIFLAISRGSTAAERRVIGMRGALIALAILVGFAVTGSRVLDFLGISLPAFRISGGLLLFWIAFEMVFERREQRKQASATQALRDEPRPDLRHLAAFPLAIPLIAGPGAISATILLSTAAPSPLAFGGLLSVIAILIGSCLIVFIAADRVDRYLGDTARSVLTRLLGVILSALAVQFVADGVVAIVRSDGL